MTVTAGAADLLGVLAFSALPFAAVQALADSDLGKRLQVQIVTMREFLLFRVGAKLLELGQGHHHDTRCCFCRKILRRRRVTTRELSSKERRSLQQRGNRGRPEK